jgi:hypothetical protein
MSIEPGLSETRMMLTEAGVGPALRARLPLLPRQPDGFGLLMRAIAAWYGQPFRAVVDAQSEDVHKHPERWARLLGDLDDALLQVEWSALTTCAAGQRDRFLGAVGDVRRAKRLITYTATGLR